MLFNSKLTNWTLAKNKKEKYIDIFYYSFRVKLKKITKYNSFPYSQH